MYKIIALCGKAGTGKSFLLKKILSVQPDYNKIVSCTTRPKREKETEGIDYYFLNPKDFQDKVQQGLMLESTNFNNWFYGTSLDQLSLNTINVGIFNPAGIMHLLQSPQVSIRIFLIEATDKIRLLRQLNREDNPNVQEIIRRFQTDDYDFSHLQFPYIPITNNCYKDIPLALSCILSGQNFV